MPDDGPCGVCGLPHPLLTICPYVQEQEIREEFAPDGRRRRLAARIVRTRYFPRQEVAESMARIAAMEGDGTEAQEADAGGAAGAPAPGALEDGRAG